MNRGIALLLLLIVISAWGSVCPDRDCIGGNSTDGLYCHECGAVLMESHYCPGCCSKVLENDGFCPSCGMKLDSFTKRVSATFVESIQPAVVWIEENWDRWFYLASVSGYERLARQERFLGGSLGLGTHQNNPCLGLTWRGWVWQTPSASADGSVWNGCSSPTSGLKLT